MSTKIYVNPLWYNKNLSKDTHVTTDPIHKYLNNGTTTEEIREL